jgi:SNF2 family DNA or RNA helicase
MPIMDKRLIRTQSILKKHGNTLYPYQITGLKRLLSNEDNKYGGILADEMGLGKTLQMISLIIANPRKFTLIIVPASLILQWQKEINKFAPHINVMIHWSNQIVSLTNINTLEDTQNIILTTYHYSIKYYLFKTIKFDRIICDEAHFFRNPKSKTCRGINKLQSQIKWCVTGTPIQNYLKDLTTLINFIMPEINVTKSTISMLIKILIIRRTKQDVDIKLPELKKKLSFIPFSSNEEIKLYEKLEKLQNEFRNIKSLEKQLRLRQTCSTPKHLSLKFKLKYKTKNDISNITNTKLDHIVKQIVKHNKSEKPIVFTHFNNEIYYLKAKLNSHNIKTGIINGSISQEERQNIIYDTSYRVLLVQIVAGGTGLNLQEYNSIYFTSPNWNPSLENQAIARVHRIGQKKNVIIRKIIMGNIKTHTIEKRILQIQKNKTELIKKYII